MAQRNYLVEGLSGVGKSAVYDELVRRGYEAISTDRAWSFHADPVTGLPGGPVRNDTWMWDRRKALGALERVDSRMLFVCGSSRNSTDFLHHFAKVFYLRIDDDTMRRRLEGRTEDDWSLGEEGIRVMLELNGRDERPAGAIEVDATRPLDQVVDELLRLADGRGGDLPGPPAPFDGEPGGEVADPSGTGGWVTRPTAHLYEETRGAFPGTGWSCWDPHLQNPASDHSRGKACDITFGNNLGSFPNAEQTAEGWRLATWLRHHASALRVKYVIFDGTIWTVARDEEGWRPYTSSVYDVTEPTGGHFDHVHVSLLD